MARRKALLIERQCGKTHHCSDGRRGNFRQLADLRRSFGTATNNCSPTNDSPGSDDLLTSLSIVSLVIRKPSQPPDFSPTDLQTCSGCLLVPSPGTNARDVLECSSVFLLVHEVSLRSGSCSPVTLACPCPSTVGEFEVTSACPQCNKAKYCRRFAAVAASAASATSWLQPWLRLNSLEEFLPPPSLRPSSISIGKKNQPRRCIAVPRSYLISCSHSHSNSHSHKQT